MGSRFSLIDLAKAVLRAGLRKRESLQCADKGVAKTTNDTGGSMNVIDRLHSGLKAVAENFVVEALAKDLQPKIVEIIKKHGKDRQRKSPLSPLLSIWLILSLPLRRELSYPNVLDWLLSGQRAAGWKIPRHAVTNGAISHARERVGVDLVKDVFQASVEIARKPKADFHGFVSMAVDGSQLTMPDSPENSVEFGKPRSGRAVGAFPQVRLVGLVATALQAMADVAFGPCWGKGTGERTLAIPLILRNARDGILFLLDRGFYGFDLLHQIGEKSAQWIVRVPKNARLTAICKSRLPDGSYFAWLEGKVEDPAASAAAGRKRWKALKRKVRVIRYQIQGFRGSRIATSLLDSTITAQEIVQKYHARWEIELAYDSIKTHQSARRTGQCPTVLRSKRPDFVKQEIYAMLAVYNLLRDVIRQAADKHGLDPLSVSFTDTLCAVLDAIPAMRRAQATRLMDLYNDLLDDIARGQLTRRRRPRAFPRVVRVKMSNFRVKGFGDQEIHRDFSNATRVLGAA
jgi:Transposase DDE domain/Insertion element 4 transposase N-terminal